MNSNNNSLLKLPFRSAYFIGIKGQGMCALAQVFQGLGVKVSGSDIEEEFSTDEVLRNLKIRVHESFEAENVPRGVEAIFCSTAYNDSNPEVARAKELGIPFYTYTDGLKMILERGVGIGVAGTHGKTTVTAMLGRVLEDSGFDPTVIVGGTVREWGSNARVGESEWVVAEVDEYQDKFLEYPLKHLIVTSVEYDHPDYFKAPQEYEAAFKKLIERIPPGGTIVYNEQYDSLRKIISRISGTKNVLPYNVAKGKRRAPNLFIPGRHNRENALAVLTMAEALGINKNRASKTLAQFKGTARRFEVYCEEPFVVIDDYAHHPGAIRATIQAARERYPQRKIWVVFQPHTFSRTAALLKEFAESLKSADRVLVLDIYGSAREAEGGVHSRDLVLLIPAALDIATIAEATTYLAQAVSGGDVVLVMGAGDVWKVAQALWRLSHPKDVSPKDPAQ